MANNWLDIQHRGFSAYLEETGESDVRTNFNRAVLCTDKTDEHVNTVFFDCDVKTDWIEKIEAALPYIENAVRENRQFILRQGEIVPIEKAKRVSKTSVEHLSRHSELITTAPAPDQDLIPDKIYMTENIGTRAVYENRFVYMLLCYIRDFTGFRYNKITELAASFSSDISVKKDFIDGERKIRYNLTYSEISHGVDGACNSETEEAVCRIRNILQTVELLLRTDLMKEVSAEPMLKPPIARTNVLLHNTNFKIAFELYTFLVAYTEDGYKKIERHRNFGEFPQQMRADFASLIAITSYLAYRCGGLYEELEKRFLLEKQQKILEAETAKKAKLAGLKAQLGEIDDNAFAYILALEERNAELECNAQMHHETHALYLDAQNRLESVMKEIEPLQADVHKLETALREKVQEMDYLSDRHARAIKEAEQQIQYTNAQAEKAAQKFAAEFEQQKQDYLRQYEALSEKYRLSNARYHALTALQGSQEDQEQTHTKESFAQLEAEYEAFKRFFAQQWKQAKKQIRKDQLWHNK